MRAFFLPLLEENLQSVKEYAFSPKYQARRIQIQRFCQIWLYRDAKNESAPCTKTRALICSLVRVSE